MQDNDFHVRLEALERFRDTLRESLEAYEQLTGEMMAVHPSTAGGSLESVLGHAILPGSARVLEASRTMLDNYAVLYEKLAMAQRVIIARLRTADTALAATLDEYATHEGRQEVVFRELLKELPGAEEGGERGTARAE
ncbi:hypothetical protein BLA60_40245 [Actinophytocola xinjiangensis]|uniref:Uncharacterized protein n=1 Tax=Actinophytocola xinjiangensis TaxID=485602 RepID=A0A7Z0WDI4_9PSEU|nr:hypothetical protein [Actinophytocola xinjiangensis]OLF04524.1 hypothetical protein BLA60_40245 [Actinophytocola xinjiangensis]